MEYVVSSHKQETADWGRSSVYLVCAMAVANCFLVQIAVLSRAGVRVLTTSCRLHIVNFVTRHQETHVYILLLRNSRVVCPVLQRRRLIASRMAWSRRVRTILPPGRLNDLR
jgi:hypothetical protein